jgi:hypothetical protein
MNRGREKGKNREERNPKMRIPLGIKSSLPAGSLDHPF